MQDLSRLTQVETLEGVLNPATVYICTGPFYCRRCEGGGLVQTICGKISVIVMFGGGVELSP